MRPAAENMRPANVRVRTNPVNAAALPELRLALSTDRRLIQAAKIVAVPNIFMTVPIARRRINLPAMSVMGNISSVSWMKITSLARTLPCRKMPAILSLFILVTT